MQKNRTKRILSCLMSAVMVLLGVFGTPSGMVGNLIGVKAVEEVTLHNPVVDMDAMCAGQKVTWDCVWFGSYPQTEVKAGGSEYASLQRAKGWDDNGDAIVNGTKYRRMKKKDATYATSGERDYYDWKDSTTYHYFRYEPVKWRVLETDGSNAMLLSDIVLDDRKYNTECRSTTWETSTIRSWLNGYDADMNQQGISYSSSNFIDSTFTDEEQSAISDTNVVNNGNLNYDTEGGNDTMDKLFLLSETEVYTDTASVYGFAQDRKTDDVARRCKGSDYAKAMGLYNNGATEGNCGWWLRSPGGYSGDAAYVNYCGNVSKYGYDVDDDRNGVRVALNLNLSSPNLYTYAGAVNVTEESGVTTNTYQILGNLVGTWFVGEGAFMVQSKDDANIYTYTVLNVKAGLYEFQIVKNNSWDTIYSGIQGFINAPYPNLKCEVKEDCDVTVTLNLKDMTVKTSVDEGQQETESSDKPTEPIVTTDTYQILGTLVGTWVIGEGAFMVQSKDDANIYTYTVLNVKAGSYDFQIVKNNSWDAKYSGAQGFIKSDYPTLKCNVKEDCDVTVTLNFKDMTVKTSVDEWQQETTKTEEETTKKPEIYTVTFKDGDDVLSVQKVESGMSAKAPKVKEREGYRLSWDKSFSHIEEDTVVNAVWTEKNSTDVTIHFKNTCNWDNVGIWIYEGVGWKRNVTPKDACPAYHTSTDPKIDSHPIWPGASMTAEWDYDGWYTIDISFEDTSIGAIMLFNNLVANTEADRDTGGDSEDQAILEASGLLMYTEAKRQTPNQVIIPTLLAAGAKEFWCDFDGDISGSTGRLTSTKPASYKKTSGSEETTEEPSIEEPTDEMVLHNPIIVKDSTMEAGQKVTWDCVWFGSYPQTEVKETDREYTSLENAVGWDSNGDTVINGTKYRRMLKGDATYATSGDSAYYDWEDDTTYYYFRYEPVKWRVLKTDGSNAMLLSDIVLDDRKYNREWRSTTWETSAIRSWLNGYSADMNQEGTNYSSSNFIDSAFTDEEQSAIADTKVVNNDNLYCDTEGGNDTVDKLFLLSESEVYTDTAVTYGFAADEDTYDEGRRCKSSDYAKAMGVWSNTSTNYKGNCWWWLRSPGDSSGSAAVVGDDGYVYYDGYYVGNSSSGVRVALNLNLSSSHRYTYARTVCSAGTVNVTEEPDTEEPTTEEEPTEEPDTEEPTTEKPPAKKPQTIKVTQSYIKTYGTKAFKLNAKLTKGNGTLRYTTSNKNVATVDKNGKVTIKGTGKCTITVTASATDTYKSASAKITITIKPKKNTVTKLKLAGSRTLNVTWKKDTKGAGYELQYSTAKNFAGKTTVTINIGKNKTTSYKIRKLAKGKKYYIRVRTYQNVKVNGKTKKLYGDWSTVKQSGKVK